MTIQEISTKSLRIIIENAGAKKINEDACIELLEILENIGSEISQEAVIFAEHFGRNTVEKKDIELAFESIMSSDTK